MDGRWKMDDDISGAPAEGNMSMRGWRTRGVSRHTVQRHYNLIPVFDTILAESKARVVSSCNNTLVSRHVRSFKLAEDLAGTCCSFRLVSQNSDLILSDSEPSGSF